LLRSGANARTAEGHKSGPARGETTLPLLRKEFVDKLKRLAGASLSILKAIKSSNSTIQSKGGALTTS
jgi:hypothetical protein